MIRIMTREKFYTRASNLEEVILDWHIAILVLNSHGFNTSGVIGNAKVRLANSHLKRHLISRTLSWVSIREVDLIVMAHMIFERS